MDIEKFIRDARPALVIELRKHAKAPVGPLLPQEEMILGCVECAMRQVLAEALNRLSLQLGEFLEHRFELQDAEALKRGDLSPVDSDVLEGHAFIDRKSGRIFLGVKT